MRQWQLPASRVRGFWRPRVQLGCFAEHLDGLHHSWVTLFKVLIPGWYLNFRFCGGRLFHGFVGYVQSLPKKLSLSKQGKKLKESRLEVSPNRR
jgi:hypothetical protein